MPTISQLKEQSATETPLFLILCELTTGAIERWSTHRVQIGTDLYEPRVVGHNLFEIRSDADAGIDALSKVTLTLSNVDSHFSQIERSAGWKGSKVTIQFLFFDLKQGAPASESTVIFRGIANPPDEITETTLRLTVSNRMNLQRLLLPEVRLQRRCPWKFPATAEQRAEAVTGGPRGKYSPFFRCGYSPDVPNGTGNTDATGPYTSCDYTRAQCEARGMFSQDQAANPTRRFGGIEFVPSTTIVRSYGEKGFHASAAIENEGRYNDFVPIVYGTAWYAPPLVFARNDGNLTHMEVLLGMGEIQGVLKVVVNDIEIPLGHTGTNMTATGWYNVASYGNRTGSFNLDFQDASGQPLGDPYGSMAVLSLVTPNRINDGRALPRIEVLLQGLKLAQYDSGGTYLGESFDNNPAWVILDILQRSGWSTDEIDLTSFATAAAYCAEMIPGEDLYGNPMLMPRFQCSLVLRRRRSAAELIRGIRNASRLYITLGADGRLQLKAENALAVQQPSKPEWSNSTEQLNGGWPSYEFGDGTLGFSGILRKEGGDPAIRFWSRSTADTPNRFSVEFQDAFNEYQQDSLSLVDVDDALRTGQEISVPLSALGMPNFHHAARIIQLQLDKSIRGNTYVEFETSVRGVGLKPGDIVTLTYLKDGFQRQPFRIKSISPGLNYRTALITAQIHSDAWYTDALGGSAGNSGVGRQPGFEVGLPRPLLGNILDENGEPQFEIQERDDETGDGQVNVWLTVGFIAPAHPTSMGGGIPMLDLSPTVSDTGGTLEGDQTLYYAVSAIGADSSESPLSFLVRATIPPGTNTNSVQLSGLSFAPGASGFNVYRGGTPVHLFRIASNQAIAASFVDAGLPKQLETAPDENYDHANFYWRFELQPEYPVTIWSADTIGNDTLQMPDNGYRGMVVRITSGRGAGQERSILSNTATSLTANSAWETEPDVTSSFVIAESGWHAGATGRSSPVEFEIPNRVGATVHVSGRSANVENKECAYELSPLTRWRIGGAGGVVDAGVPGQPVFGVHATGQGTIELLGVGFVDLTNTRTITAATLTLYYWSELAGPSQILLAGGASPTDDFVDLSSPGGAEPGSLIQVDSEIMLVNAVLNGGLRYDVARAIHGSLAEAHGIQTPVYHLSRKVFIVPFVRDFFGSPSSGSYSHPIFLPDVRIASAELVVTNMRGNSPPAELAFTSTLSAGLRTLSGGQLSIQVEGYLAIQSDVAPPLVIEEAHSVRDVFAVVREAPAGAPIILQLRQDAAPYCTLTIPSAATVSNVVDGFDLPNLAAESQLNLDILSVGQTSSGSPGRDLTVTIRL